MCGIHGAQPFSTISQKPFCTMLLVLILSSYLPFLSLFPPQHNEEAEKWEPHSQTPLYCQFLGLQHLWELEESLLLSNTFAPCVKDKEHHERLWGPGSPVPHKLSKPGFNNTWTVDFHMFKLVLERAEEPEIKLPTSIGSSKKQESSRETFISALLSCQSLRLCGSQ